MKYVKQYFINMFLILALVSCHDTNKVMWFDTKEQAIQSIFVSEGVEPSEQASTSTEVLTIIELQGETFVIMKIAGKDEDDDFMALRMVQLVEENNQFGVLNEMPPTYVTIQSTESDVVMGGSMGDTLSGNRVSWMAGVDDDHMLREFKRISEHNNPENFSELQFFEDSGIYLFLNKVFIAGLDSE